MYGINIDGSDEKELTPFEKVQVRLVDDLEDDEEHMLISMNKRNPRIFDVYRINIISGEMEMIAENPGNVVGWLTDHDGQLRLSTFTDGANTGIRYRKTEQDEWQTIATYNFKESAFPLFFTFDNRFRQVSL